MKILILGKKQKTYKQSFDTREIFTFEAETDIIDLKDLVKQLPSLSLYNLQVLSHLIDAEFLAVKTLKNVSELFNKIPFLEYENDFSPEPIEEVNPDNVVRIVYRVNVPLYSDPECRCIRPDVSGVILETRQQPGNVFAGYSIHPTTCKQFKQGIRVIRLYSRYSSWSESWYRDPDTNEITYAWTESSELIGRSLELQ
ncbi:hypothetical protein IQ229_20195 [Nostoc cf. edaphicum LEGE 07299]|uniref:Uncharacterized protein n=1 Tax=Nostoc cf. edaphicum LEGE 07299 TaxID=2777974 RepID=A0ABR9U5P0_9NOSO|nr:hypothetical protein [Nostoc cf. edaphicum LEGE 07299]